MAHYLTAKVKYTHTSQDSDKVIGIIWDISWSQDAMKITVSGAEICIRRIFWFEAGDDQSKMAPNELVSMDLS